MPANGFESARVPDDAWLGGKGQGKDEAGENRRIGRM
jgi:hypothetical protein